MVNFVFAGVFCPLYFSIWVVFEFFLNNDEFEFFEFLGIC